MKRGERMERVHFDENGNRRDCIGGKIKKEDHEHMVDAFIKEVAEQ